MKFFKKNKKQKRFKILHSIDAGNKSLGSPIKETTNSIINPVKKVIE